MSKKCQIIANKTVAVGNKVSHSNIKTKRRFLPNLQNYSLKSDALGCNIRFRASPKSIRLVDLYDGLDQFLLSTSDSKLASEACSIKSRVKKALKKKSAGLEQKS